MSNASVEERLERWSRLQALVVLGGLACALHVGRPWPLAPCGVTFVVLLWEGRRAWTPRGTFGWANLVTSLRLAMTLALPACLHRAAGPLLSGGLLLLLTLDGFDGWLSRRLSEESPWGAHFDMETDAFLVMLVDLELWQRGTFGPWILTTGILRYAYVLFVALAPGPAVTMPRSRWARYAFVTLMIGLVAGLALPNELGAVAAVLGSAAVTASFARSFYWSYRTQIASVPSP